MNFLNKLERKCGQYAVKNLINYLLIGYGIGYILELLSPDIYSALQLSPALVMKGQVWRLFTWILTTPESLGFFTIFMFMFYYWIGHTLENYWGTFRYNVYMISGYLIMTIGAMLIYGISYQRRYICHQPFHEYLLCEYGIFPCICDLIRGCTGIIHVNYSDQDEMACHRGCCLSWL